MRKILGALIVFWISSGQALAKDPITIGHQFTIKSEILSEERSYKVNLPATYDNGYNENYAVLYVLDGATHFSSVSGVVNHMSSGNNVNFQIPELIVVGVDNMRGTRTRDMTPTNSNVLPDGRTLESLDVSGGGDNFLDFIEQELVPHIDRTYRTKSHRTIFGHSHGGLIALHSLLTRPNLFHNYITVGSNLWWDGGEIIGRAREFVESNPVVRARVYIASGLVNSEKSLPRVVNDEKLVQQLSKLHSKNWQLIYEQFPGEDRKSLSLQGLYNGLLSVFEGYWIPADDLVSVEASLMTAHYKKFSESVGVQFLPSEYFIEIMVRFQGENMKPGVALALLEMNAKNYPESDRARKALARYKSKMLEDDNTNSK